MIQNILIGNEKLYLLLFYQEKDEELRRKR